MPPFSQHRAKGHSFMESWHGDMKFEKTSIEQIFIKTKINWLFY